MENIFVPEINSGKFYHIEYQTSILELLNNELKKEKITIEDWIDYYTKNFFVLAHSMDISSMPYDSAATHVFAYIAHKLFILTSKKRKLSEIIDDIKLNTKKLYKFFANNTIDEYINNMNILCIELLLAYANNEGPELLKLASILFFQYQSIKKWYNIFDIQYGAISKSTNCIITNITKDEIKRFLDITEIFKKKLTDDFINKQIEEFVNLNVRIPCMERIHKCLIPSDKQKSKSELNKILIEKYQVCIYINFV